MQETNNRLPVPTFEAKKLREKRLRRTIGVLAFAGVIGTGVATIAPLYEKTTVDSIRVTPNGDPDDVVSRAVDAFEAKHPDVQNNDIQDIGSADQQVGGDIAKYIDINNHTPESVTVELIKDGYGHLTLQGEASDLPPNQDEYATNQ